MSLGVEKYFIYGAGVFGIMAPWVNRFSALKRYQFERAPIYNLFATFFSAICFLFIVNNGQENYFLPRFTVFMVIGLSIMFSFFLYSEYNIRKYHRKINTFQIAVSVLLYSISIGIITAGMALLAVRNYYYTVSGEVKYLNNNDGKLLITSDLRVTLETDIDNVSFNTRTDKNGYFLFYIDEAYINHVVRISLCKGIHPPVFRNIELDGLLAVNKESREIPPFSTLYLKSEDKKCR